MPLADVRRTACRLMRLPRGATHSRGLTTVAVGVSGGVDSSVAALLLKEQGHDVIGVHMTNWDIAEEGEEACGEQEARDAHRVCEKLGIGFHRVSFVREYWNDVFTPFLDGYLAGGTPNPDVACNRLIKFDRFMEHALSLGADRVATGHYARLSHQPDRSRLLLAADASKDQTFFLATVRQDALRRCDFPLGGLLKSEVRARAEEAGLHTAQKRDSTGICFIGRRNFADFLEGYLPQEPGEFVCVETGASLGEHRGYAMYTPGQRARVGGQAARYYVVDKDVESNVVRLAAGSDHPALFAREVRTAVNPSWIGGAPPPQLLQGEASRHHARVRHPGELLPCSARLVNLEDSSAAGHAAGAHSNACADALGPHSALHLTFDHPIRYPAEMQAVALYDGDECLGGAIVQERGQTLWEELCGLHRGFSGSPGATTLVGG